jgi:hypothetical protein
MNMEQLRDIAGSDHRCMYPCYRDPCVEARYQERKRLVLQTYATIEDYILYTVLKCGGNQQNSQGKLKGLQCEAHAWGFCLNEFPYNVSRDVEHWVLWHRTKRENMDCAERIIRRNFGSEAVWFVNAPEYRTVPGLFHVHVFVDAARGGAIPATT